MCSLPADSRSCVSSHLKKPISMIWRHLLIFYLDVKGTSSSISTVDLTNDELVLKRLNKIIEICFLVSSSFKLLIEYFPKNHQIM